MVSFYRGVVLLLLLCKCLLEAHSFPGIVLPVKNLLLVNELGTLSIHQFFAEMFILEQL